MAKTIEPKSEEIQARSYADQLILRELSLIDGAIKLSDIADKLSGEGLGLAAIRSLLASNNDLFAYHERRWVPKARLTSSGRPLAAILYALIDSYRIPMPISLIQEELERIQGEAVVSPDAFARVLEKDRAFIVDGDKVILADWGFVADDEEYDRGLALNGVTVDEVNELSKKVGDLDFRAENAVAKAVEALAPVNLRTLGALFWTKQNSQDPRSVLIYSNASFLRQVFALPGYFRLPDGSLQPASASKGLLATAVKLADKLALTVSVEDATPIEIKAEDVTKLVDRVKKAGTTLTATKILEEVYEITPSNKTFPDDMANIMDALRSDSSIHWVGGDRFRAEVNVPEFYYAVPDPFYFTESTVVDAEGELVDVELNDDGLNSSLRKLLSHPLATDVLDEDILPAPKQMPETIRLVLKSIHRELGTFPMCQIPTGWLSPSPNMQELIFRDAAGRELQVWANHESRLIYNLIDWWFEQPVESGAVFTITRTPQANVFDFAWLDQPDPVVYISAQRMEQLRGLGEQFEGRSTLDLLIEVFSQWPKGADYLTLLAEVNVARRTSRRLIASLLSSYQCFYQRSGSPVWHFDAKKVEQGFDKTKKKFIKK